MLSELRIQDFAIIEALELKLGRGFVVFTGETGAGKSIMIDAVETLLGGRADSTMIRSGAEIAIVEGAFDMQSPNQAALRGIIEREDLSGQESMLILAREIRREGRNVCRVNGRSVNLAIMREIGELLVDVHGQSEHLSLLRVPEHLQLLDRYARVEAQRQSYQESYRALNKVVEELESLRRIESDAARRADLLAFQINEIESAALKPGEDVALHEERNRLANAEQLSTLAEAALAALDSEVDESRPASASLGEAAEALDGLARIDPTLSSLHDETQSLLEQAADIARRLRLYREEIEFNPARLEHVEERGGLIRSLERKYGSGIERLLGHAEAARRELDSISHAEERLAQLAQDRQQLLGKLGEQGAALSQARRRAAEELAQAIEAELRDLHMAGAKFSVQITWKDQADGVAVDGRHVAYGPFGLDQVEFLIAPNPGEGLKPLARIASGGETSRLMLGLKGVLARADQTPTLIFDEIDQGIGGRVGAIVGRKLWGLTASHQVLCITHLPPLAAYGDQHFRIEKEVRRGRTMTIASELGEEARRQELAKMLGSDSRASLESADELMQQAAIDKAKQAQGKFDASVAGKA
jgi:DNA repair protein RecN (Recombination protein N)